MNTDYIINTISLLCDENNISVNKALIASGVGKDLIANLKKGQTPSATKISLLAAYFNVSTDYLLGKTENLTTTSDSEVNVLLQKPINAEFMKVFTSLSPAQQQKILDDMKWLKENRH